MLYKKYGLCSMKSNSKFSIMSFNLCFVALGNKRGSYYCDNSTLGRSQNYVTLHSFPVFLLSFEQYSFFV